MAATARDFDVRDAAAIAQDIAGLVSIVSSVKSPSSQIDCVRAHLPRLISRRIAESLQVEMERRSHYERDC